MRTVVVSDLIERARLLVGKEGSLSVTDNNIFTWMNDAIAEFYEPFTKPSAPGWSTLVYNITLSSGVESYTIPTDFYRIKMVQVQPTGSTTWTSLENAPLETIGTLPSGCTRSYRIEGQTLYLVPPPINGGTLRLFYIPAAPYVGATSDVIDGVNGFDEFIVVYLAVKILQHDYLDASDFIRKKDELMARMMVASDDRGSNITQMVDVRPDLHHWVRYLSDYIY